MLALPWSRPGCPPLSVALPNEESEVVPNANILACRPALTNAGWLRYRSAAGTAADDEEEEEDDESPPPPPEGGSSCGP